MNSSSGKQLLRLTESARYLAWYIIGNHMIYFLCCVTVLPFSFVFAGYGGGYMERDEIVEYKDRSNDSDDEYDEVNSL
jgi:hypothetical protein